jgi:hypothetical protein
MTLARKTHAKYGAKIPTARLPDSKPAVQGRRGKPTGASAKAAPDAKGGDDKKP